MSAFYTDGQVFQVAATSKIVNWGLSASGKSWNRRLTISRL